MRRPSLSSVQLAEHVLQLCSAPTGSLETLGGPLSERLQNLTRALGETWKCPCGVQVVVCPVELTCVDEPAEEVGVEVWGQGVARQLGQQACDLLVRLDPGDVGIGCGVGEQGQGLEPPVCARVVLREERAGEQRQGGPLGSSSEESAQGLGGESLDDARSESREGEQGAMASAETSARRTRARTEVA